MCLNIVRIVLLDTRYICVPKNAEYIEVAANTGILQGILIPNGILSFEFQKDLSAQHTQGVRYELRNLNII